MKKTSKLLILSTLITFCSFFALNAQQIRMPSASPSSVLKQTVGLTDVTVTYSRPSMKGRVIFGDLVPYDKLWRTGANMATKIEFSDDVKIEGKALKSGAYALFTIPGKDSWTIIFNSNYNQGGSANYKESEDVLRVNVKPEKMNEKVESFTIDINDLTANGAKIWILWENTAVPVKIDVDTDAKVMADIESAMDPASDAGKYYAAANYYFEANKDLDKALMWINKSIELGNNRFWVVHLKAKIQEKKGDCKEAVKTAETGKALAKEAGNEDYVALNDKLIARCKGK